MSTTTETSAPAAAGRPKTRAKAATAGLALPALMALGMSADTSFRFLGTPEIGITNGWERGLLCGVAEAAVIAFSVYSWATRSKSAAWLAYAIVLCQVVPAFAISGAAGGGFFRVALGPVLLAVVLHYLLGLELRVSGAQSDGLLSAAVREAKERLTAYCGIGRRGADSAAIARSRAADRAVDLADLVTATKRGSRRYGRRTASLAAAMDAARHGLAPEAADAAEAAIVGRIVRRKSAGELATITERHNWAASLRSTGTPVPAAPEPAELEAHGRAELPPGPVPAAADSGTVPEWHAAEPAAPAPGSEVEPKRNSRNQLIGATTGQQAAAPGGGHVNGTRADHIRALVAGGVTDTGIIRNALAESGVAVPTDRYIRRLVKEGRNTEAAQTGTNGYM